MGFNIIHLIKQASKLQSSH